MLPVSDTLFEGQYVTVVCGDAREVLPELGRETVDCVVTDPPYGVAWRANRRSVRFEAIAGDGSLGEARRLLDDATDPMVRALRRNRHAYTFGLPLHHDLISARAELVWDKHLFSGGDLTLPYGCAHETIHMHVRAADRHNAAKGVGALAARLRRGSVLRVTRPNARQVRRHPTEKPVELVRQLVESSTVLGDLVLDPFAGAGSTGVAAVLTGRRALLVELDEGYAQVAADRAAEAERLMAGAVGL